MNDTIILKTTLAKTYDFLFVQIADDRVKDWKFMKGPEPLLGILALYLVGLRVVKSLMEKRKKPFNLRTTIICYDMIQICACSTLIYGIVTSGWMTHYSWGCQLPDYSQDPISVRMLKFVYVTFFVKALEMVETFFFMLRKKFNQASFLHIYHHGTSLIFAWIGVKYIGSGMATFPIIVNSSVHILMYTYYMLSSMGLKSVEKFKSTLTIIQMVQFCILVGQSLMALRAECRRSPAVAILYLYVPHVSIIFYMFWNFYRKSYLTKTDRNNKKNK